MTFKIMLGYIFVALSVISYAFSSMLLKYLSGKGQNEKWLIIQYGVISIVSFLVFLVMDTKQLQITPQIIMYTVGLGIVWYLGIWAFIQGLKHLQTGIVLVVGYSYVILSFFSNYLIFWSIEALSSQKIFLAGLFFILLAIFLIRHSQKKWLNLRYVVFPILAAMSWTVYYGIDNYLMKKSILSPYALTFLAESAIAIIAFFILLTLSRKTTKPMPPQQIGINIIAGICTYLGSLFLFFAYVSLSANIVNVLSLSCLLFTPILSFLFLRERFLRSEIILVILAAMLLILFIIV